MAHTWLNNAELDDFTSVENVSSVSHHSFKITGRNHPGVLHESPCAFSVLQFTEFATRLAF